MVPGTPKTGLGSGYGGVKMWNEDHPVIRSVNHRGYSALAPENTLPAYKLSKEKGFQYVETDVSFTSDGVAMLLHDATIDRTSNGSGKLSEMTFSQVRQFDFGSWKSPAYSGTVIPTFTEFLELCRSLLLYPYVELKPNGDYTQKQIESIIDLVEKYGIGANATYISFSPEYLEYVRNYHPSARLGYLRSRTSPEDIEICRRLKTSDNSVFFDVKHTSVTDDLCRSFAAAGIPVEVWTVNQPDTILGLNPYISGITSDSQNAGEVLNLNRMNDFSKNRVLSAEAKRFRRIWQRIRKSFK